MARIFEGIPLMNSYYICIVAEANNIYSLSSSDFVIFLYIQIYRSDKVFNFVHKAV